MEAHGGEVSFLRWARDHRAAIEHARDTATSWGGFHQALAELGIAAELRGAGLVLRSGTGAMAKASQVSRQLSLGALEKRWGAHEPSAVPLPAGAAPPPRPMQKSPKAPELHAAFLRARNDALTARRVAAEKRAEDKLAQSVKLAHSFVRRRLLIQRDRSTPKLLKHQEYKALAQEQRELQQAQRGARRDDRKAIETAHPLPTWNDFLRQRAEAGDLQALEVLRARDEKRTRMAAQVLSAPNAAAAQHVVMQGVRKNFRKNGDVFYELADGGSVRDGAHEVEVEGDSTTSAAFAALALAAQRFPGQPLVVEGTPAFRAQVAEVAATRGLDVRFADPALDARRLAAQAPTTAAVQQTALDSFVNARNKQAERLTSILHHRVWEPADAGDALYRGRRQLEGLEVVLLERGGDMLVKTVTPAQAAKASTLAIGASVTLDERGRFRSDDRSTERD